MLNLILTAIVLAVPAYMIYTTIHNYVVATGTAWERLGKAFKESATIFCTRLSAISAAAVGAVGELSTYLGAPGVKEAIEPYLSPKYMLAYMLITLIGAEIARRRTL